MDIIVNGLYCVIILVFIIFLIPFFILASILDCVIYIICKCIKKDYDWNCLRWMTQLCSFGKKDKNI